MIRIEGRQPAPSFSAYPVYAPTCIEVSRAHNNGMVSPIPSVLTAHSFVGPELPETAKSRRDPINPLGGETKPRPSPRLQTGDRNGRGAPYAFRRGQRTRFVPYTRIILRGESEGASWGLEDKTCR